MFGKKLYRQILRLEISRQNRKKLIYDKNNPISIISSNCVGGVILHDLGLRFNTPTINLYFEPDSYLRFIEKLEYYCSLDDMQEIPCDTKHNYPRGILGGDVIIHFLHYLSFQDAYDKWRERCRRINYNNLYFMLVERDGITVEQMRKYDSMRLQGKKVLLTCNEYDEIKCAYNLGKKCRDLKTGQIIDICQYMGKFTGRRYIDGFDYVDFLNS